jgi:hypothetical protein
MKYRNNSALSMFYNSICTVRMITVKISVTDLLIQTALQSNTVSFAYETPPLNLIRRSATLRIRLALCLNVRYLEMLSLYVSVRS